MQKNTITTLIFSLSLALSLSANSAPLKKSASMEQKNTIAKQKLSTKVWNLRQANIRSVIQAVSRATNKNFILDPRVQGKVSIISSKAINEKELYQVFLSMLQVSGFAAIPTGNVTKIIPNIDARSTSMGQLNSSNTMGDDEMVVRVITINHVSAEQLVPVIRPLMPQWSNVSAYSPSNALILSGRASNIHRLAEVIQQVDTSNSNSIDTISLRYALAMDIVSTIKSLMDSQKNHAYQRNATIAADDASNSILISGSKTERLRIRLLISQLDNKKAYSGDTTEVVYLKYLKAQDILPILSGIAKANFSGSVGTTIGTITTPTLDTTTPVNSLTSGSAESSSTPSLENSSNVAPNTQASQESSEGSNKPKVQIIAEPNSNSIILNAPQALMRTLKTIINKLDTRPQQVMVEAIITEINESDVNNLGFEWGMVNGTTFSPGFAIISSSMSINNFQAQLHALVRLDKANILSTPSVVVLDNRQAKILVGQQISIQESTNNNTTSGGSPYATYSRQNVALHLYVKPQISQGNSIQLQIDHGNDTLQNEESATNGLPVINTSNIQTSVLVNSGDVLVLGGLVQNGRRQVGNKMPIIGDLPGIGELFQKNAKTKSKKVLMVFIRPIILDSQKKELQVTNSKYMNLRDEQLSLIREEEFNPKNKEMAFKRLNKSPKLPVPFSSMASENS